MYLDSFNRFFGYLIHQSNTHFLLYNYWNVKVKMHFYYNSYILKLYFNLNINYL